MIEPRVNREIKAEEVDENNLLKSLAGELAVIKKTLSALRNRREQGEFFDQNGKRYLKFTKEEIKRMPEYIKKTFVAGNYLVSYRITQNGYYEARMHRGGVNVEASGRDFETMRSRFMERLEGQYEHCRQIILPDKKIVVENEKPSRVMFVDYADDWLRTKELTIKASTYKEYARTYNHDIRPKFQGKYIDDISRQELQDYLFGIVKEGKHRKAEKLALMLNCIFDMASDDYNIPSPMKRVVIPKYQSRPSTSLTKDEEEKLIKYCKYNKDFAATDALLVMLCFGLRRSELKSIKIIDDKWLQCETSKERLGQNVVLRKIPITPMARKILPGVDIEKARETNLSSITTQMTKIFKNHHPHELRHTFISRCKECGVNPEVVSIWAGHSLSGTITTTVYTHYSEDFQLKEAEKVKY